ncbi:MAG: RNA pyrophosphohydrolase [Alphaproteobacteria bacterium]
MATDLPYRPCAGIMLVNDAGKIWVGERTDMPAHLNGEPLWQMPQGGIDPGEDPRQAAIRELYEETNVTSATMIAPAGDWLSYDLPADLVGVALKGKYRGQRQMWFLMRFHGPDSEINVRDPGGGAHSAEFARWKWVDIDALPACVASFKRPVYEALVVEFGPLVARTRPISKP